jgi:hypothetical protein
VEEIAYPFPHTNRNRGVPSHYDLLLIIGFGQNRYAVVPRGNVGATPSSCIFEEVRLRHYGGLLATAVPYRKGASHDCSSTTNDGGYAGTEFFASYPGILSPTGFAVRTPLR